jgi:hypothetical protein
VHETTPSSTFHTIENLTTPVQPSTHTNDHVHGTTPASIFHAAERVITPIQPPVQPGTSVQQQLTGGFTSTSNSANPTFTVLKATTIQHALGHPLAYVRVLMQVSYSK